MMFVLSLMRVVEGVFLRVVCVFRHADMCCCLFFHPVAILSSVLSVVCV